MDGWIRIVDFALSTALMILVFSIVVLTHEAFQERFGLGIAVIVVGGIAFLVSLEVNVPTDFAVVGENDEIVETHSIVSLKSNSRLDGETALSFGYLTEQDEYILMVRQDDGGYRRKSYPADGTVVYEDADVDNARVEVVDCHQIVRGTYRLPIIGEWTRDNRGFSKREIRIHVPKGSIVQGEYDFQ